MQRPMNIRRISSQPSVSQKMLPPPKKATTFAPSNTSSDDGPLFCRYSIDLQRDQGLPLDPAFQAGGNSQCRDCNAILDVEPGRAWKITKEVVRERISTMDYDEEIIEDHVFLVLNRFMIKSHQPGRGYACILCMKHRDKDILVDTPQGLVRHIQTKHEEHEYADSDIRQIG